MAIPIRSEPTECSGERGPLDLIGIHCTPDVETDADGSGVPKLADVMPDPCDSCPLLLGS